MAVTGDAVPPPLRLIADPVRWRLLRELADGDLRVRELAAATGEAQNLVSYHLRRLRSGGLVSARRSTFDGRDTYYSLDLASCAHALAEDGEPLDALVWLEEPTFPGCLVTVRPIAVFWMLDEGKPDAKVLTVGSNDLRMDGIQDLEDVPAHLTAEIGHFFNIYKELEPGKSTDVRGWQNREAAEREITDAQQRLTAEAS